MAKQERPKASPEAMEWLVKSRNRIQELILHLDQNPNLPRPGTWQKFVGAAFSLWRAVFLVFDAQELAWPLGPQVEEFLRKVLETNSITFPDDLAARAWSGGYYINNARYRLGMETKARPAHSRQRDTWEETFNELQRRIAAPEHSDLESSEGSV